VAGAAGFLISVVFSEPSILQRLDRGSATIHLQSPQAERGHVQVARQVGVKPRPAVNSVHTGPSSRTQRLNSARPIDRCSAPAVMNFCQVASSWPASTDNVEMVSRI